MTTLRNPDSAQPADSAFYTARETSSRPVASLGRNSSSDFNLYRDDRAPRDRESLYPQPSGSLTERNASLPATDRGSEFDRLLAEVRDMYRRLGVPFDQTLEAKLEALSEHPPIQPAPAQRESRDLEEAALKQSIAEKREACRVSGAVPFHAADAMDGSGGRPAS